MERNPRAGLPAGLGAYLIWGILPVYWKQLTAVPSGEILAWRVTGCAVLSWMLLLLRPGAPVKAALTPRTVLSFFAAAMLLGSNWLVYNWAVANNRLVEASLGYYINPLVNVALGVIFLSERLGGMRLIALLFALAGVGVMTIAAGVFPWVSVVLAISFGFYGLNLKHLQARVDGIEVLAWVTGILGIPAAAYLGVLGLRGEWHIGASGALAGTLLAAAGIVTFIPLRLFGIGARHLPLGVLGFLQYIAPTTMLIIGTVVYGEPFDGPRAAAFGLVLAALGIYSPTFRGAGGVISKQSER